MILQDASGTGRTAQQLTKAINSMGMVATVLEKLLGSKLGEYCANGDLFSVCNLCLKLALTIIAHHKCQYAFEAPNNTPIATLDPSRLGNIQFAYSLGTKNWYWSRKGGKQAGKHRPRPKIGVMFSCLLSMYPTGIWAFLPW